MWLAQGVVTEKGKVVADDDRYKVYDYDLDDLTVSVTELKGGRETRGHSHRGNAEVYFFIGGQAEMQVGDEKFKVEPGAILIPKGKFHKVYNRSTSSSLVFIAVFSGKRGQADAQYATGGGRSSESEPARIDYPAP